MYDKVIFQQIPFPFKVQYEAPTWSLVKSKAPKKSELSTREGLLLLDLKGFPGREMRAWSQNQGPLGSRKGRKCSWRKCLPTQCHLVLLYLMIFREFLGLGTPSLTSAAVKIASSSRVHGGDSACPGEDRAERRAGERELKENTRYL